MLELWNRPVRHLASAEARATVLVIVPVAAGAIMLAESRRISGRGQIGPARLDGPTGDVR
jgi:hypothetical protein